MLFTAISTSPPSSTVREAALKIPTSAAVPQIPSMIGPEFLAGSALLVVLALGQFVNVATGSVGYLLMMTGHEKLMRNSVAIAAALNLALNLTLVPVAGAMGAAIATAISLATLNLVATYYVWSHLGIVMIPFLRSRTNE